LKELAVVYYSFEGNTELVAKMIKEYNPNADLIRLVPDKEPPRSLLGKFIIGGKSVLLKEKVMIRSLGVDLNDYQAVIIASPVWAGSYPPALAAFFDRKRMEGKDVYLIACSASGNAVNMINEMVKQLDGNQVMSALSLRSPAKDPERTREQVISLLRDIRDMAERNA
jgi:flavodoxin